MGIIARLKEFLYFICDDEGRTYAVDIHGSIVTTPSPKPLQYTPDGWQETALQYTRNVTYGGIVRTSTTPFGFVKDGAKILRYLWYTSGVEAKGNLAIGKLDRADLVVKKYYYGALNFSQATDGKDKMECEVTEAGLSMMIKANENTKYEVDLDVPEAVPLRHNGLILKANVSYAIQQGPAGNGASLIGCIFITSEGTFRDIVFNTTYSFISGNVVPPASADSTDYVIRNDGPAQTFTLSFKYTVTWDFLGSHHVDFSISNGISFISNELVYSSPAGENLTVNVEFTKTVTLQQGERLFITASGVASNDKYTYAEGGTMNVTFDYRYRQTEIKCLRPLYVFQKLIEKITDGKFTASSNLLSTLAKDYVLTSGDGIRGISGAKIKTSLKDFFTSYNARFCIGLGNHDEVAVIEPKASFYTTEVIADLGEVADCQVTNATDYLYNTLKIGWPAQDYDDVNGKDEFNNTHNYTSPVKRFAKEMDLTAPYRTDAYGIEFTRINLAGKNTTDNESDNDVFIINITDDGSGGYILNRPPYTAISGVRAGSSIFNVELSPARCLIANGAFLHVGMDLLDSGSLTFQTTEKNAALSTTLDGVTIAENQNFLIGSLAAKLFLPKVFDIDCRVPVNIVNLIEANPYGKIQFKWLGNTYRGYIMEAAQQPATNAKQAFKLLACTDNDMSKLIH
jgi:hypothetical protein